ncbi:Uncharacterized conserved protein [Fulvimarina manganoxydans]|uniref:Uncharacterized conserved protein n=2 Tax=Fulvimarina manganoxydans TaxID=937218 RepID=A0A1W2EV69_9HYPH|nr:Uncharacterized conserved protein [Fulvimarina manganoxydans]
MPICDPRFCETKGPGREEFGRLVAWGNKAKTQGLIARQAETAKGGPVSLSDSHGLCETSAHSAPDEQAGAGFSAIRLAAKGIESSERCCFLARGASEEKATEDEEAEQGPCPREVSSPGPETERQTVLEELRGAIARIEGALPARLDAPRSKVTRLDAPCSKIARLDASDPNISRLEAARQTHSPLEAPSCSSPKAETASDYSPKEKYLAQPASGGDKPAETEAQRPCLSLGHPAIDAALGGGLPRHGLIEIRAQESRDMGALIGFCLALAARLVAAVDRPLLWIGERSALGEAGLPYPPGFAAFGLTPRALALVSAPRLKDAVWAAEEAAASRALALAVLEVRGNPALLSLDGTRRLHLRARKAGTPLLLLRQSAEPQATAAPLRLAIRAGPALTVPDLPTHRRLIGAPTFCLEVEKNRAGPPLRLDIAWSRHDRLFFPAKRTASGEPLSRPHPAETAHRPDHARTGGARLAL